MFVLCALAVAAPAQAHVQRERDNDDVQGHLDIKRALFRHEVTELIFEIKMHDGWAPRAIKGINGGINLYLDTAGDDRLNYVVVIAKLNKGFDCRAYNRKGDLKTTGDAEKISGDTIRCTLSAGSIRRDGRNFKWAAQTSWKLSKDNYTYDYAPNEGYFSHKL